MDLNDDINGKIHLQPQKASTRFTLRCHECLLYLEAAVVLAAMKEQWACGVNE